MKHTKEPWERPKRSVRRNRENIEVWGAGEAPVLTSCDYEGQTIQDDDMDRAITCVNALAGIEDPPNIHLIIYGLAESDPRNAPEGSNTIYCNFCGWDGKDGPAGLDPDNHEESCAWRLARRILRR